MGATPASTATRSWRHCRPLWFRIPSIARIFWIVASVSVAPLRHCWRFEPQRLKACILVRDLHSPLSGLVEALHGQGVPLANIILVDTGSTAPPCLAELRRLERLGCVWHRVSPPDQTFGPYGPWLSPALRDRIRAEAAPFLVTDADLEVPLDMPETWLQDLMQALNQHRFALKVSLPLRIHDLTVPNREQIRRHEQRLMRHPGYRLLSALLLRRHPGRAVCTTDTTLSLYRPSRRFSTLSVRLHAAYALRHLPWYRDFVDSPEFRYYTDHKLPLFGEWSSLASVADQDR